MNHCVKITFIAPCFSHGATDAPEVRPASIRGMLHHWFRLLGGTFEQERAVFGGVKIKDSPFRDSASKVVVRVRHDPNVDIKSLATLPHKPEKPARRNAFAPGHSFELFVSDRLGGLKEPEAGLFHDALYAWLLMGTLGFRSTRIAGSFVFDSPDFPQPDQPQAYLDCCRGLLGKHGAPVRVGLLRRSFKWNEAEKARRLVSDSLGGPDHQEDNHDLKDLHDPLGKIGTHESKRKTSPLKYRLLRFGGKFQILAVWDGRENVTGNTLGDLSGVINLLSVKKPELGRLLAETGMDI